MEWNNDSQLYLDFSDQMLWILHGSWGKFCDTLDSILKSWDKNHPIFAVIFLDGEYAALDNNELVKLSKK